MWTLAPSTRSRATRSEPASNSDWFGDSSLARQETAKVRSDRLSIPPAERAPAHAPATIQGPRVPDRWTPHIARPTGGTTNAVGGAAIAAVPGAMHLERKAARHQASGTRNGLVAASEADPTDQAVRSGLNQGEREAAGPKLAAVEAPGLASASREANVEVTGSTVAGRRAEGDRTGGVAARVALADTARAEPTTGDRPVADRGLQMPRAAVAQRAAVGPRADAARRAAVAPRADAALAASAEAPRPAGVLVVALHGVADRVAAQAGHRAALGAGAQVNPRAVSDCAHRPFHAQE